MQAIWTDAANRRATQNHSWQYADQVALEQAARVSRHRAGMPVSGLTTTRYEPPYHHEQGACTAGSSSPMCPSMKHVLAAETRSSLVLAFIIPNWPKYLSYLI